MERWTLTALFSAFLLFALVDVARAEDDFIFTHFLETPLLILTVIIVIDVIAFIYHKIKK